MRYTIRPKKIEHSGGMSVTAMDAREALNAVKQMIEDGRTEVEIFDEKDRPYDLVELERITLEAEQAQASKSE